MRLPLRLLAALGLSAASVAAQLDDPRVASLGGTPPLFAPSSSGAPLSYASYLGGALTEVVHAVAVTPGGGLVIAGQTSSGNFPVLNAAQPDRAGLSDGFVAQFGPSGALEWATFLGGNDTSIFVPDSVEDVVVSPDGSVTVVGTASGNGFPTTPGAVQPLSQGGLEAFAARFDATGALLWATHLGGSDDDYASGVAVDAQGRVVLVGRTFSGDLPVTPGAFDETENSLNFLFDDAWVARLSADGSSLDYLTYAGGLLRDEAYAVALTADGSAIVTGLTGSSNFPTTPGAYDESFNGGSGSKTDAFLLRLSPEGDELSWSTFLGATERVEARSLALDAAERPLIGGLIADGGTLATPGAFQETSGGGLLDGWLASFSADGSALRYATLLGGVGADEIRDVAYDSGGRPTVVGTTGSSDFPTRAQQVFGVRGHGAGGGSSGAQVAPAPGGATPALGGAQITTELFALPLGIDPKLSGATDGFVARFTPDARALMVSSFLGGSGGEDIMALAHDGAGAIALAGSTSSTDLSVSADAQQVTLHGDEDGFLARLQLPPLLGLATAAAPAREARLVARGRFAPGAELRLALHGAVPEGAGWLLLGDPLRATRLHGGWLLGGAPNGLIELPAALRSEAGLALRWPVGAALPERLALQALWRTSAGWTPGPGLLLLAD